MFLLFRARKHELDAVLLVDLGCTGIVVYRDNVRLRVDLADFADHALAGNVIGQTAERLGADDIGNAFADKLDHFRRQSADENGRLSSSS